MGSTVNVQEAKTRLSDLLARVEAGEQVTITRNGTPVAQLEPVAPPRRRFGLMSFDVPNSVFFDPLPDDELARWE